MALNDSLSLSASIERRKRLDERNAAMQRIDRRRADALMARYPEMGAQGMSAAPEQSWLGEFLGKERGALGLRIGDFVPGVQQALSAKDFRDIGLEREAAMREGNYGQAAMASALQGLAGLGALPMLGGIIRPGVKGASLKTMQRLHETHPELGAKFGPREGFYSKLERAVQEMPQPMNATELRSWLKSKHGVKDAEIDTYDIETLLANTTGRLKPEEVADWVMRRRPAYTETRKAGTGSTWAKHEQSQVADGEPDMDAFAEWRQQETSNRIDDDVEYNSNIGVERLEDEDGNVTGWQAYNAETGDREVFDEEDEAIEWMDSERDAQRDRFAEYYDEMSDDEFVNRFHRSATNVRDWAESTGNLLASEADNLEDWTPAYFGHEPNMPTDAPMYAGSMGRWGESHYSPGKNDPNANFNYLELIQQMEPIARTHKQALEAEAAAPVRSPLAELKDLPLFASAIEEPPPDWRRKEIERIPERATRNWSYSTHWEEPNPVEHIRGYLNVPELAQAKRSPNRVYPKPIETPITDADDALQAGYTYKIDAQPGVPAGAGDTPETQYYLRVFAPDGEQILDRYISWGPTMRGGLGGDISAGSVGREAALERYARATIAGMAERDRTERYNAMAGATAASEDTGRRGMLMSELQADLEQQSRREYFPWRNQPKPTREELARQGWSVRAASDAAPEASEEFYGPGNEALNVLRRDIARMQDSPQWQEHMASMPAAEARTIEAIVRRLNANDIPYRVSPFNMYQTLREEAAAAGVPEDLIPPARGAGPQRYQYGRMREQTVSLEDPAIANQYNTPQPELLLDLPMGQQIANRQWTPEPTGYALQTPEEAWAALIEDQSRDLPGGKAPRFPLDDDKYQLALKRSLLEAAHTNQDFVAWNTPETMDKMNAGRGATLFPNLYKQEGYLGKGPVAKALGVKPSPIEMQMENPYLGSRTLKGFKLDLNEKLRQKIIDEGFPLWMVPMLMGAGTAGILGYMGQQGSEQNDYQL